MYKIFCESYINYINSFDTDNYRVRVAKPIELLVDVAKYQEEKRKESKIYQEVSDLLCYLEENTDKYPRVKAFLWTIEARGMKGKKYQIAKKEDLEEQIKIVNSFLKLAYWY